MKMYELRMMIQEAVHEIISDFSHDLITDYSLFDLAGKKVGTAKLNFKPCAGDRIRLDDDTLSNNWPAFEVVSVEFNQSGSTGTLTGKIVHD